MNTKRTIPAALATLIAAGLALAGGDTVVLKDGRSIVAPILKETSEKLWLDLGHDVIAVPWDTVESVDRAEEDDAAFTAADADALFRTASGLPDSTPRALAKRIGDAVIKVSTPSGLGSGFIIHPEGYAITNAHVVQGETKLKATIFEETDREFRREVIDDVEILAVNNHVDLALIKVPLGKREKFPFVYVQGSESLEAGQETFAIGNPLGLERTLSRGVIATTQRAFQGLAFIQTTAQINPGNSGGPLFNLKGEVIGVTNMGIPAGEGLGFAIPARYVRDFLNNYEGFAYDKDNPNSGYNYQEAPPRSEFGTPAVLDDATGNQ